MAAKVTEEAPLDEARKVNLTRSAIYAFLSRAFKLEIDEPFLQAIATIQPTIELLSSSDEDGEMNEGNKLLIEFTEQVSRVKGEEKSELLTDLAAEYASLFLGVGETPVFLVESVYLGKEHLLYEEPYHEVLAAYRSLGFEKEKTFTEPEDHVAVEFEFMANLCTWTLRSLEGGDVGNAIAYLGLQKEFLGDHITRWVPALCKKLGDTATSSFYKALAHLTNGFLTMDNEIPDHLIETLRAMTSGTK